MKKLSEEEKKRPFKKKRRILKRPLTRSERLLLIAMKNVNEKRKKQS
ncbi:hypothetical protein [Mesonia mobilis]|uniref:Uncharacterized protein n=1 Tax=Mesonia mobilis TaxID=369791 RepID=A0ABQ3BHX7_9FLAO|nr:hypothetical protein [Mesonia mobilis]MBQ0737503.1 hypothetical protein [Aquimarina celericrescens]GGZ45954.1 hypothetical protein GCM10008088_04110 [Mesonia mobilis]